MITILTVFALPALALAVAQDPRGRRAVGVAGVASGLWMAFGGVAWRGVVVDTHLTLASALGLAATWAVVALRPPSRARAGLLGAASGALLLASVQGWTVPFLILFLCASSGLLAVTSRPPARLPSGMRGAPPLPGLPALPVLADLLVVVSFAFNDGVHESWRLPSEPGGVLTAALVLASLLRLVLAAREDVVDEAPLLVSSAFVLLTLTGSDEVWLGGVCILAAAAWSVRASASVGPLLLLAAGCSLVVPEAVPAAAVGGLWAVTAWKAGGRSGRPSSLALVAGPWPGTALFVAVSAAAGAAVRQIGESGPLEALPHLMVALALPMAVAACVRIGAAILRHPGEARSGLVELCGVGAFVSGLSLDPGGSGVLYAAALVIGLVSMRFLPPELRGSLDVGSSVEPGGAFRLEPSRPIGLVTAAALPLAWLVAAWLTVLGLRNGFL